MSALNRKDAKKRKAGVTFYYFNIFNNCFIFGATVLFKFDLLTPIAANEKTIHNTWQFLQQR